MRKVFAVLSVLLTTSIVLQFYLAAVGVFSDPADHLFGLHTSNGRVVIPLLALLTIVAAALARAGKRMIWLSVLPLVLVLFQAVLFVLVNLLFGVDPFSEGGSLLTPRGATIMLGFHAVNGTAIFFVCTVLIRRTWKQAFATRTAAALVPELPGPETAQRQADPASKGSQRS